MVLLTKILTLLMVFRSRKGNPTWGAQKAINRATENKVRSGGRARRQERAREREEIERERERRERTEFESGLDSKLPNLNCKCLLKSHRIQSILDYPT